MAKQKYYVIWKGRQTGVFTDWASCQKLIVGFKGARYKSFPDRASAEEAFRSGPPKKLVDDCSEKNDSTGASAYEPLSVCADAACSGNPGDMEYRVVHTLSGEEIFRSRVYPMGTNNIGEFLAIVHALAWMKQNEVKLTLYSDSETAILWARKGKAGTKLEPIPQNAILFELIERAEKWLSENGITVPLRKWETEDWGEIPADFGRKGNFSRGDKVRRG